MSKKKPHHAFNATWRFNSYFFIGWKLKDYNDYVKRVLDYHGLHNDFSGDGHSIVSMSDGAFIWAKKHDPAVIAHESYHCANWLLEQCGVKTCADNDEPIAYLLTWFMNNCGEKWGNE